MSTIKYPDDNNIIALTIASGESLTEYASVGDRQVVGMITPDAWTAASLTFQASSDGASDHDVYDEATERAIIPGVMALAGKWVALDPLDWLGMTRLRLRSGVAALAVNQAAARTIKLVLAPNAVLR